METDEAENENTDDDSDSEYDSMCEDEEDFKNDGDDIGPHAPLSQQLPSALSTSGLCSSTKRRYWPGPFELPRWAYDSDSD